MRSDSSNDNGDVGAREADAHGEAAMLLVESLVHGLIARDVISLADAVEIVDVAAEVKADGANEHGRPLTNAQKSLGLLTAISSSLRRDLPSD